MNEWISIKKELPFKDSPNKTRRVLLWVVGQGMLIGRATITPTTNADYIVDDWFYDSGDIIYKEVTHWACLDSMGLPPKDFIQNNQN